MQTLRSLWAWTAIGFLIVSWVPIMWIVNLLDKDPARYRTGLWFRRLGSALTRANPAWKVRLFGVLPDEPRRPFVVVCNHQSMADSPVICRLPWDMKWVAKESLFHVPLVGWMMGISRDIPVDRKSRISRAKVFIGARERLAAKVSVMIFPEGTRSRDGRVGAFTDGAFRLAIDCGVPILPMALDGTANALPKRSWRFGQARDIRLHVFEPISVDGLTADDAPDLNRRVRDLVLDQLAEWRGVDRGEVNAIREDGQSFRREGGAT